ncbi:hypothetical protein ACIQZG_22120 [Lysinibacillus sp. NPDC096418]|uniref:hypothetical protein n=1 Tax=Lysinibacillus sp. NPDC096418 TaxID=3364138 RepID=UPI0037F724F4
MEKEKIIEKLNGLRNELIEVESPGAILSEADYIVEKLNNDLKDKYFEKLQDSLNKEKSNLRKDEIKLVHLKYNQVLKQMLETKISPDEALRAILRIDNEYEKNHSNNNHEGEHAIELMEISEAEWVVSEYEKGEKRFSNKTVEKAYKLLEESPYEKYECEFCDIEWTARKNTEEHKNKLCYKCWLRMKA